MAHRHMNRHLRRSPDFWGDINSAFNNLNPWAQPTPTPTPPPPPGPHKQPTPTPPAKTTGATTVTQVVYLTQSPTFSGPIGGFSTVTSSPDAEPTDSGGDDSSDSTSATGLPAAITSDPAASAPPTVVVDTSSATPVAAQTSTPNNATPVGQTSAPPSITGTTGAQTSSSSSGHSGAATAGIVIGVLAAVLVVFLGVWFLFNRRRRQQERERLDDGDEKLDGGAFSAAAAASHHADPITPRNAPRISLRPVTQFLPQWGTATTGEKRSSRAGPPAAAAGAARAPGQTSMWERENLSSSHSNNPANPFGRQAERMYSPIAEESASPASARPLSPLDGPATSPTQKDLPVDPLTAHGPAMAAGAAAAAGAGAGAGVVAAAALTRKTSIRKDGAPAPLDLTVPPPQLSVVPPSPAGTEFSVNSVSPGGAPLPASAGAAAIAAAGGPQASTVHRVQLDFKPTLEDEMELVAGQLVRLLHEYDDGWALCIRLDRSQQGAVPRTCLSARPVKPRPNPNGAPRNGPPIKPSGPGARGPGPNGPMQQQQQRPQSPAGPMMGGPGPRPSSPATGRPMSPYRPGSPAGGPPRSQSPGPRYQGPPGQQPRPQSPSGGPPMGRRMSPPGLSPMNPLNQNSPRPGPPTGPVGRKPVPGQAM